MTIKEEMEKKEKRVENIIRILRGLFIMRLLSLSFFWGIGKKVSEIVLRSAD